MKKIIEANGLAHGAVLTRTKQEEVLVVTAWPDEVHVEIKTPDGDLTIEEATELVALLTSAIEMAPKLDIDDDTKLTVKAVA